jgi:hypothetical protein
MPPTGSTGLLKLAVSSASRGLKSEPVGEATLNGLHPGIYNTIKFPIPDTVRRALGGATFKDLSFEFGLNATAVSNLTPTFLFDNLRVSSVPLVTALTNLKAPASFGGSVTLVATGDAPEKQSFNIGAVQVPESFRLLEGAVGSTTVKFALGHDSVPAFTCSYDADPADKTAQTYQLDSCTGGVKGGDLVGANYAELAIVRGTSLMKLVAQLAVNPLGDLVGSDAIPAMPTFWGRSDGCVPETAAGLVHSTSTSCANQVAEASQIVTDYFNKVNASKTAANWIVAPVGDRAIHHGTALANPGLPAGSPEASNFPFSKEGHLNQGGDFDAYWRLAGDLNTRNDPSTGNSSGHFDATFSGHVVLFGDDSNVMSVSAAADTSSGSSPSATASVHMFLFGVELPGGGSINASAPFTFNISQSKTFSVLSLHYWIFALEVEATATASVHTTGTIAVTGFAVTVDPKVSMGTHIFGGVDLGVASGGVDAKIDLLDVSVPIHAQAGLATDISPSKCSVSLNFSVSADVTVSAVGGEIDLVAKFGICPFCDTESYTLLKWDPLFSTTQNLFTVGPTTLAATPLPITLCTQPLAVTLDALPTTIQTGVTYSLTGAVTSPNAGPVSCNTLTWSINPAEQLSPAGCHATLKFDNPGTHTLKLSAVDNIADQFGRTISETGLVSRTFNVTTLPVGAYIVGILPAPASRQPLLNNQSVTIAVPNFPAPLMVTGEYVDATGAVVKTNTTWTATDSAHHTALIAAPPCTAPACTTLPNNQVAVKFSAPAAGTYIVKMTATDNAGKVLGTTSMTVNLVRSIIIF